VEAACSSKNAGTSPPNYTTSYSTRSCS